jgi:hypothetical protein
MVQHFKSLSLSKKKVAQPQGVRPIKLGFSVTKTQLSNKLRTPKRAAVVLAH